MYKTCAFCSGPFGGDGGASGLGVGRRFAYDAWKSRAWVVCAKCRRWNLTPYDTRLDTIAALDRMAAAGRVAATSSQVALLRSGAYEMVRVGKPPRVELATWRYGERLKARERERLKVLLPFAVVGVGAGIALAVASGGGAFEALWLTNFGDVGDSIYSGVLGNRKLNIEPPVCDHCGRVMVLRAKHIQHARLSRTMHQDLALLLSCPHCRTVGAMLEGDQAEVALRHGLTFVNLRKAKRIKKKAAEAAEYLERHGGPERIIAARARLEIPVGSLAAHEALALEMAVDEQAEVRELEREWRRAEEIAEIADNLALNPTLEEEFRRLKEGGQPSG